MIASTQRSLERAGPTLGKSNAANWAARWTRGVPDRANDPKRKVSLADIAESMSELDEEQAEKGKK